MQTMVDVLTIYDDIPVTSPSTLYDLMMVLQDATGPDRDDLVVVIVTHLLHSGRLTFVTQGRTYN